SYLARIRAIDSPLCTTCGIPETVAHFLFTCKRYSAPRHTLRQAIQGPLTFRSTLGSQDARAAVLEYVKATGRFLEPGTCVSQGPAPSHPTISFPLSPSSASSGPPSSLPQPPNP
ncbi:hypothetical protein C8Q70DRAFT_921051, partial [Cubamyces menziesii]